MTTLIFYEKPGCATNARQKRLLLDAGHEVIARDVLREPWTAQRLRDFFDGLPVADWFNRAAPQLKSGEIDPARIDAQAALEMMLSDPLLIRRPLIEAEGWRLAGFDAAQIEQHLGIVDNREAPPSSEAQQDSETPRGLEDCSRPHAATPCATPQNSTPQDTERAQVALAYHERTKHRPDRYASGPETLDWSMQPDPFRTFKDSPSVRLPLCAGRMALSFDGTDKPEEIHPPVLSLDTLGALLELSLGLSAWKEYGPDRWALRCNPSSGNLHPTEAYVIAHGVPQLDDGLYHYASRSHALELRCRSTSEHPPGLWIGLSSIHWREAWKYGERAFRYCQLDVGHALAALRYAAGLLGWQLRLVPSCNSQRLTALLGTGRDQDYADAEREEPDLLVQLIRPVQLVSPAHPQALVEPVPWDAAHTSWTGQANILDPHPMYHWPVIDEVASATESNRNDAVVRHQDYPPGTSATHLPAPEVIMGRRSAQRFDPQFSMAADDFYRLVDSLLPRAQPPWDIWDYAPQVHPVFFVHRVEGLPAGLYILVREAGAEARLRAELSDEFEWQRVAGCPAHLPLFRLQAGKWQKLARVVSCQQAIAADSCFSLGMLAEFEHSIQQDAWRYRQLHWEAGLLGHVLYLQAEMLELRGTGIGCFLDDAFHELLGLRSRHFQSLYHFTVGHALVDTRITTLPPYPERTAAADTENVPMKNESGFRCIGAAAASQLLARDPVLVLDSRDQASFDLAHIAAARRLSSDNLDAILLGAPKFMPVLLYCYHGNASQTYGQMFADFGFAEVYSLDGGFEAWQQLHPTSAPPMLSPQLAHWLQQHGYPGNNLEAVAEHGMTPLMRASKAGDTAIILELIQAGASLDTKNANGNHALWLGCVGANSDTLDVLIRAGSALDHQNDNGATCLMYAASTGKHAVVEKLLAAGANPQLKTLDDFSALDMAATIECLRLLRGVEKRLLQAVG